MLCVSSSSDAQFIDDWNALLSTLVICDGEIIICGDVNLHLDNSSNHYTRLFTHSLNAYGFMQNIQGPTHYQGHTLDVFITRDSSTLINDLTVIFYGFCGTALSWFKTYLQDRQYKVCVTKNRIVMFV